MKLKSLAKSFGYTVAAFAIALLAVAAVGLLVKACVEFGPAVGLAVIFCFIWWLVHGEVKRGQF